MLEVEVGPNARYSRQKFVVTHVIPTPEIGGGCPHKGGRGRSFRTPLGWRNFECTPFLVILAIMLYTSVAFQKLGLNTRDV